MRYNFGHAVSSFISSFKRINPIPLVSFSKSLLNIIVLPPLYLRNVVYRIQRQITEPIFFLKPAMDVQTETIAEFKQLIEVQITSMSC